MVLNLWTVPHTLILQGCHGGGYSGNKRILQCHAGHAAIVQVWKTPVWRGLCSLCLDYVLK